MQQGVSPPLPQRSDPEQGKSRSVVAIDEEDEALKVRVMYVKMFEL